MRGPRLVRIMILAGGVALVAGAACMLSRRTPLPRYELLIEGGRTTYLDSQPVQALDAQSLLSITLRPAQPVTRRIFAFTVVTERSQQSVWPVLFDRTTQGTLRLQAPLRELRMPCQSRCTVTFYISDLTLFPSLIWLVPQSHRDRPLPQTQSLRADVLIEPRVATLSD